MTREQTIELIKYFPRIGQDIKLNEDIKRSLESDWDLDSVVSDGMPRGTSTSDPTGKKGCQMAINGSGETIRAIEKEIDRLKKLQTEIFRELKILPYYQKQVIYYYYLDGKRWSWVAMKMNYSEKHCRRIRDIAITNLRKVFEKNKYIQPLETNSK